LKTLRPGLLVSLKTSIVGNTEYRRVQLEADHITAEGTKRARWETERTIVDPKERARASEIRSQCRGSISRVCSSSTFGMLCPEDKKDELDTAVQEAQKLAQEFNAAASLTRVHVFVLVGRIAPDDEQAVRAINSEVGSLLADMERGIQKLDVKAVRDAANKAKSVGQMLSPDAAERVKTAVEIAREIARKIVKAGDEAAIVINQAAVRKITESRTMFLDIEEMPVEVVAPQAKARAVDLDPAVVSPKKTSRKAAAAPQLELE
jgi:hypothetical protein